MEVPVSSVFSGFRLAPAQPSAANRPLAQILRYFENESIVHLGNEIASEEAEMQNRAKSLEALLLHSEKVS
jgi:hypothetical protein